MAATSRDVARLAGVSQATVSRAFSPNGKISDATRERIVGIARELGYVPNLGARAMKTGRTNTIGVVVADLTNPFYPGILDALTGYLDAAGQKVTLWNSDGPGNHAALDAINAGSIDGIIFTTVTDASAPLRAALDNHRPVVLINRIVAGLSCDQVASDNRVGGAAVADYVVQNGHRRIGLIGGPDSASTARDRTAGFIDQLGQYGISVPPHWAHQGAFSHNYGFEVASQILDSNERPTAIFCSNDLIAFGALDAARTRRVAVPEELWVIGYDDIDMSAWPAFDLTTMHQPSRAMAEAGAETLMERIDDPSAPFKNLTFRSRLVPRGSTADVPVSTAAPVRKLAAR